MTGTFRVVRRLLRGRTIKSGSKLGDIILTFLYKKGVLGTSIEGAQFSACLALHLFLNY